MTDQDTSQAGTVLSNTDSKARLSTFWQQFPNSNFVSAGRNAYRLGIHIASNPYKFNGKPYCDLWDKGYRLERRKVEGGPLPFVATPLKLRDKSSTRHTRSQPYAISSRARRPHQQPSGPFLPPKKPPMSVPATPADLQRLDRFQLRNRTAA